MSPKAASREFSARAPRRAKCFALAASAGGNNGEIVTSVRTGGVMGVMVSGGRETDRQGVSRAIGGVAVECRKCSVTWRVAIQDPKATWLPEAGSERVV